MTTPLSRSVSSLTNDFNALSVSDEARVKKRVDCSTLRELFLLPHQTDDSSDLQIHFSEQWMLDACSRLADFLLQSYQSISLWHIIQGLALKIDDYAQKQCRYRILNEIRITGCELYKFFDFSAITEDAIQTSNEYLAKSILKQAASKTPEALKTVTVQFHICEQFCAQTLYLLVHNWQAWLAYGYPHLNVTPVTIHESPRAYNIAAFGIMLERGSHRMPVHLEFIMAKETDCFAVADSVYFRTGENYRFDQLSCITGGAPEQWMLDCLFGIVDLSMHVPCQSEKLCDYLEKGFYPTKRTIERFREEFSDLEYFLLRFNQRTYAKTADDRLKELFYMVSHLHHERAPYFFKRALETISQRSDSWLWKVAQLIADETCSLSQFFAIDELVSSIQGVRPLSRRCIDREVKLLDVDRRVFTHFLDATSQEAETKQSLLHPEKQYTREYEREILDGVGKGNLVAYLELLRAGLYSRSMAEHALLAYSQFCSEKLVQIGMGTLLRFHESIPFDPRIIEWDQFLFTNPCLICKEIAPSVIERLSPSFLKKQIPLLVTQGMLGPALRVIEVCYKEVRADELAGWIALLPHPALLLECLPLSTTLALAFEESRISSFPRFVEAVLCSLQSGTRLLPEQYLKTIQNGNFRSYIRTLYAKGEYRSFLYALKLHSDNTSEPLSKEFKVQANKAIELLPDVEESIKTWERGGFINKTLSTLINEKQWELAAEKACSDDTVSSADCSKIVRGLIGRKNPNVGQYFGFLAKKAMVDKQLWHQGFEACTLHSQGPAHFAAGVEALVTLRSLLDAASAKVLWEVLFNNVNEHVVSKSLGMLKQHGWIKELFPNKRPNEVAFLCSQFVDLLISLPEKRQEYTRDAHSWFALLDNDEHAKKIIAWRLLELAEVYNDKQFFDDNCRIISFAQVGVLRIDPNAKRNITIPLAAFLGAAKRAEEHPLKRKEVQGVIRFFLNVENEKIDSLITQQLIGYPVCKEHNAFILFLYKQWQKSPDDVDLITFICKYLETPLSKEKLAIYTLLLSEPGIQDHTRFASALITSYPTLFGDALIHPNLARSALEIDLVTLSSVDRAFCAKLREHILEYRESLSLLFLSQLGAYGWTRDVQFLLIKFYNHFLAPLYMGSSYSGTRIGKEGIFEEVSLVNTFTSMQEFFTSTPGEEVGIYAPVLYVKKNTEKLLESEKEYLKLTDILLSRTIFFAKQPTLSPIVQKRLLNFATYTISFLMDLYPAYQGFRSLIEKFIKGTDEGCKVCHALLHRASLKGLIAVSNGKLFGPSLEDLTKKITFLKSTAKAEKLIYLLVEQLFRWQEHNFIDQFEERHAIFSELVALWRKHPAAQPVRKISQMFQVILFPYSGPCGFDAIQANEYARKGLKVLFPALVSMAGDYLAAMSKIDKKRPEHSELKESFENIIISALDLLNQARYQGLFVVDDALKGEMCARLSLLFTNPHFPLDSTSLSMFNASLASPFGHTGGISERIAHIGNWIAALAKQKNQLVLGNLAQNIQASQLLKEIRKPEDKKRVIAWFQIFSELPKDVKGPFISHFAVEIHAMVMRKET